MMVMYGRLASGDEELGLWRDVQPMERDVEDWDASDLWPVKKPGQPQVEIGADKLNPRAEKSKRRTKGFSK
ncbi:hypothetical protein [uncultured Rubinisphaera sp.]|uniref:hypothetical protein n=1 Tax=uncultured Rubinisphaera sp. TaxID=1678686 RepID=UPI0030DBFBE6